MSTYTQFIQIVETNHPLKPSICFGEQSNTVEEKKVEKKPIEQPFLEILINYQREKSEEPIMASLRGLTIVKQASITF